MSYDSPAAAREAKSLYVLVESRRATVQQVRDLISISPADEKVLRAAGLVPARGFRRMVLREFDRLVRESHNNPVASTVWAVGSSFGG